MSELDPFFKFKIGDSVRPRVHRPGYDIDRRKYAAQELVILERWLHECYGGIQANYLVRVHVGSDGFGTTSYGFVKDPFTLTEPELVPFEVPELSATKPERKKDED